MPVINDHTANLQRQEDALNRRYAKVKRDRRFQADLRKLNERKKARAKRKLEQLTKPKKLNQLINEIQNDTSLSTKKRKQLLLQYTDRKRLKKLIEQHQERIDDLEEEIRGRNQEMIKCNNKLDDIDSKLSEVEGERASSDYMRAMSANPPSRAPANTYAMIKGFTAPGPGIDQIWVRPADWDGTVNPTEIVIVEAKGGKAKLSPSDVYPGEEGIGGVALPDGCREMDNNWIYINAGALESVAESAPLLAQVGRLIRAKLDNPAGPAPPLRKLAIQKRPTRIQPKILMDEVYPNPMVPAPVRQVNPPIAWIGNTVTKANLDTTPGMADLVTRCADIKAGLTSIATTPPAGHADAIFQQHVANLKARRKALRRLARIRAERAQAISPTTKVAQSTKLKASLGEVRGELLAAESMARIVQTGTAQPKYKMIKGFSGPDKGIDQIWVSADWNPNAFPRVPPNEIMVVEAKGYDAEVSRIDVYEQALGSSGHALPSGAQQMTKEWVYVNAVTASTQADDSNNLRTVATYLKTAIATGGSPPAVRGVVLKNGAVSNPWWLGANADGTIHYN